jgi:dihydroflavonol-4-reductase
MIFVTGGTGLVGSHLLFELVKRGHKVRALKRSTSNIDRVKKLFSWYTDKYEEYFKTIEWVEGDLRDIFFLEEAIKQIEVIYHCAAIVSFDPAERKSLIRNNVGGTANLINAALSRGVKRICYIGSNSTLGKAKNGFPITEESSWIPSRRNSGYSESKFFSEAEIWRGVEEGLEATVVIPAIIIGPGNWNNSSAGFFSAINKGLKFYPRGITGFVDVRDVIDAVCLLMDDNQFEKSKNQRFLLNAENLRYKDFFQMIADALQKPAPTLYASNLMIYLAWGFGSLWSLLTGSQMKINRDTLINSNKDNYYDGSKITRIFNFTYRPIRQAIEYTADCFLKDQVI